MLSSFTQSHKKNKQIEAKTPNRHLFIKKYHRGFRYYNDDVMGCH